MKMELHVKRIFIRMVLHQALSRHRQILRRLRNGIYMYIVVVLTIKNLGTSNMSPFFT